jgi:glycosyltransferase involved in cell wall biosynthesis
MKLLHLISSMDPRSGGPCQGIRNLTPHTALAGNTIQVVCLDDPKSDYLSKEQLSILGLGKGRGPWSYHAALRPWLNENLTRFDAVFLHGLWQYPGYSLSRALRGKSGPPYFVFPHGMLDPWFQRSPQRRMKAVRNWVYWKVVEQRVIREATAVFFTCAEEMRLASRSLRPYRPKRQVNVGYGIQPPPKYETAMTAAFAQSCPELGQRPYFLFLGRIDPKKGVDALIKAYASLNRTQTKDQLGLTPSLVIAGPGLETPFGQEVHKLAQKICPPSTVLWPGMLTGASKWGALHGADAFLLPSHQENFGIAVVEAMACATPVLISNQINIWREIAEDKAGFVAADTLEGTKQLFKHWSQCSDEEKLAMKNAAAASFSKRFGIERAARTLLATIRSLTATSDGTARGFRHGPDFANSF